jgi:peptidoglycan/xylan/chitin deacetylase (PgdA/CDA1 family)
MTHLPNTIKVLSRICLHRFGLINTISWYNRNRFQILTYHRFTDGTGCDCSEALEKQCAYISEHFTPVTMSQIADHLHQGTPPPSRSVVTTVDDGYRDFLTVAYPLFHAYKIPVTVYLVTDFIDGRQWPWWNKVDFAVQHTSRPSVEYSLFPGHACGRLSCRTDEERQATSSTICEGLKKVSDRIRVSFIDRLPDLFEVNFPKVTPLKYAPLTWNEIRLLHSEGIEFGAHTKTHPILTQLAGKHPLYEEIAGSKSRVEEELRCPIAHFAYPNGDFNQDAVDAVKTSGFLTATTVLSGFNSSLTDQFLLKRRSAGLECSDYYFREHLAGMH